MLNWVGLSLWSVVVLAICPEIREGFETENVGNFDGVGSLDWSLSQPFAIDTHDWAVENFAGTRSLRGSSSSTAATLNAVLTEATSIVGDLPYTLEWNLFVSGDALINEVNYLDFYLLWDSTDFSSAETTAANSGEGYKVRIWDFPASTSSTHNYPGTIPFVIFSLFRKKLTGGRWGFVSNTDFVVSNSAINVNLGFNIKVTMSPSGTFTGYISSGPIGTSPIQRFQVDNTEIVVTGRTWYTGFGFTTESSDDLDQVGFDNFYLRQLCPDTTQSMVDTTLPITTTLQPTTTLVTTTTLPATTTSTILPTTTQTGVPTTILGSTTTTIITTTLATTVGEVTTTDDQTTDSAFTSTSEITPTTSETTTQPESGGASKKLGGGVYVAFILGFILILVVFVFILFRYKKKDSLDRPNPLHDENHLENQDGGGQDTAIALQSKPNAQYDGYEPQSEALSTPDEAELAAAPLLVTERDHEIPPIVLDCVKYLAQPVSLSTEGLFRVPGSQVEMNKIKKAYESGKPFDLSKVTNPLTVAGVLKLHFRQANPPLLSSSAYPALLSALSTKSNQEMLDQLYNLDPVIYATLQHLINCLVEISKHSDINMMHITNMSMVWGGSLFSNLSIGDGNALMAYWLKNSSELFINPGQVAPEVYEAEGGGHDALEGGVEEGTVEQEVYTYQEENTGENTNDPSVDDMTIPNPEFQDDPV
eukprot:Lithocolla_globosa_v1_NODE_1680_length_2402_cov_9.970175.p1 type:complete len:704 gc:universal NODE_1680_length_2402_cov_9.970175:2157-46(-)